MLIFLKVYEAHSFFNLCGQKAEKWQKHKVQRLLFFFAMVMPFFTPFPSVLRPFFFNPRDFPSGNWLYIKIFATNFASIPIGIGENGGKIKATTTTSWEWSVFTHRSKFLQLIWCVCTSIWVNFSLKEHQARLIGTELSKALAWLCMYRSDDLWLRHRFWRFYKRRNRRTDRQTDPLIKMHGRI